MFLLKLTDLLILFITPILSAVLPLPDETKLTAYYQRDTNPYMLIIGQTGNVMHCHQYEDRVEAERVLAALNLEDVENVEAKRMESLLASCTEDERLGIVQKLFIYPGTKWCGMGNIAANESELGKEKEADFCCRDHDHCNDSIPAFGSNHNLTNYSPFTKSNCDCDRQFHSCLDSAGTKSANVISELYFKVLLMKCFEEVPCSANETCDTEWQFTRADPDPLLPLI